MTGKLLKIWLTLLVLSITGIVGFKAIPAQADTFYNECIDGEMKDGYLIEKVSAQDMDERGAFYAIRDMLDYAKENATSSRKIKIVVEPGTYNLTGCLCLYSNTYLYLDGVTLLQDKEYKGNILKVGEGGPEGDSNKGYYYQNITIEGGILDKNGNTGTIFKSAHTKNLTLYKVTLQNNLNAHEIEIAATDGFTLDSCTFQNQILTSKSYAYEAVQLDVLQIDHMNGFYMEALPMKNVKVVNNTFKNVIRGIGSHTMWYGLYNENVNISNNKFIDVQGVAIECLGYINCLVENNVLTRCGRGITCDLMLDSAACTYSHNKPYAVKHDAKTIIRNNKMTIVDTDPAAMPCGIFVHGAKFSKAINGTGSIVPAGNYYISGVTVSNNTISSPAFGIRVQGTRNSIISGNKVVINDKTKASNAISIGQESQSVSVNNNTISGSYQSGVMVYEDAAVSTVSKNIITSPAANGINVTLGGSVSKISSNVINTPKSYGIVANGTSVDSVTYNTVTKPAKSGVYATGGGRIGTVSYNKVTSPGEKGIAIYCDPALKTKSGMKNILSNVISGAGQAGISIQSTVCDMTVKSNSVSKCKEHGIYINTPTVKHKISISKNKVAGILSRQKNGIQVSNGYISISSNKISGYLWGINISQGSSKGNVYSTNSFSGNTNNQERIVGKNSSVKVKALSTPAIVSKKSTSKGKKITWKKVSNATGYIVYRASSKNGTYSKIGSVSSGKTVTYVDSKAKNGKTYYYKVMAFEKTTGNAAMIVSAVSNLK